MDLIITVDTEADNQWRRPSPTTTQNIRFIPRFQALCDRFAFKPTYLAGYLAANDAEFQNVICAYQESRRAEIGAHLHPWATPPVDRSVEGDERHHPFPHELPADLFEAKLAMLTDAVEKAAGRAPTSYRAGRFGFTGLQIAPLLSAGYVVDCSVTPYVSHAHLSGLSGGRGGPDFRAARPGPYYPDSDDCTRPGQSSLLEVPVTILFPRWPSRSWRACQDWQVRGAGRPANRLIGRLGHGPRWLRPWRNTRAAGLIRIYRAARTLALPCVEMMFHSSELMPGGSPEFPDRAAVERLYGVLEKTFAFMAADGCRSVTLTQFARNFSGRPEKGGSSRY